jgi:hypothetical protein
MSKVDAVRKGQQTPSSIESVVPQRYYKVCEKSIARQ